MQKHSGSVRLFESDFLEKFSHVHPIVPLVFWTPVIAFLVVRSFTVHQLAPWAVLGVAIAALFVWTLAEYLLHRWVFHFQGKSHLAKRFHLIIHGNHHDVPQDPTRLVMPPVAGVLIALVLWVPMRLALGPVWVEPFFAFFLVGYLIYDYTHYAVHHFTPRTRWGRHVKQNHMLHHYAGQESRWGVSSPLWDHVFRTVGRPVPAPRKSDAGSAGHARPVS